MWDDCISNEKNVQEHFLHNQKRFPTGKGDGVNSKLFNLLPTHEETKQNFVGTFPTKWKGILTIVVFAGKYIMFLAHEGDIAQFCRNISCKVGFKHL